VTKKTSRDKKNQVKNLGSVRICEEKENRREKEIQNHSRMADVCSTLRVRGLANSNFEGSEGGWQWLRKKGSLAKDYDDLTREGLPSRE